MNRKEEIERAQGYLDGRREARRETWKAWLFFVWFVLAIVSVTLTTVKVVDMITEQDVAPVQCPRGPVEIDIYEDDLPKTIWV